MTKTEAYASIRDRLVEFAEIVNKFKSEQVQLRILEVLLEASSESTETAKKGEGRRRRRGTQSRSSRRSVETGKPQTTEKTTKSKVSTRRQGALAILNSLLSDGFFKRPRSIANIIDHCDNKLARKFRANELSGKLVRLVRLESLDRNKNKDGQYEYVEKKSNTQ